MINLEMVCAFALRDPTVMDALGAALRDDLVNADPYKRRIVEFADSFMAAHRTLPADGDYQLWLDTLPEGMIRDGTKEALNRLVATSTDGFNASFFATEAAGILRTAAARVAKARLNQVDDVSPDMFATLTARLESIQAGGLRGLAHLDEVDTWLVPPRDEEYTPTGFQRLDHMIGGWGKELWIIFADSGVGKSMLLQCFAANAARSGKRVLHVTLELGMRQQIHRYYRNLAHATRSEFTTNPDDVKLRLAQWFKFAKGEILLMEFPAFGLDHDELRRTIERVTRAAGPVDMLVLDYIDLLTIAAGKRGRGGAYEDLGRMTHEVRAMCNAFDMTVLTASQAVRRPKNAKRLTQHDMGDSYQKVRAADGLITLVQTDEEEQAHQGRIGIPKARDTGGRGLEIAVYINRELAVISELETPGTIELMRRLGHLPTQIAPTP